jgi:type II secretory pathway pseudopilin PulG
MLSKDIRRGFGVVEVLIVVTILGFVVAIVIASFNIWRGKTALRSTARDIESTLKLARSKSLASEDSAEYGVQFPDIGTSYKLCKNPIYDCQWIVCTYSCGTEITENVLPLDISFCSFNKMGLELHSFNTVGVINPTVIFDRLTGAYQNIDPLFSEGTAFVYNKNEISEPCNDPAAITACLAADTCIGITITNSGVVYERES